MAATIVDRIVVISTRIELMPWRTRLHALDVVGGAAEQVAGAGGLDGRQRQAGHGGHDLLAQLGEDAFGEDARLVLGDVRQRRGDDHQDDGTDHRLHDPLARRPAWMASMAAQERGQRDDRERRTQLEHDGDDQPGAVGAQQRSQSPDDDAAGGEAASPLITPLPG